MHWNEEFSSLPAAIGLTILKTRSRLKGGNGRIELTNRRGGCVEMLGIRCRTIFCLTGIVIAACGCSPAASPKKSSGRSIKDSSNTPMGPSAESSRLVMRQRLTGARLAAIGGGDENWSFTEKQFVFKAGKKPIPADLLKAILATDQAASRIDGNWRLEGANRFLVLSAIRCDGKDGFKDARLTIEPAGPRVNIGGPHQYQIEPMDKPAGGPEEESVVAYDSKTHGALQVNTVTDRSDQSFSVEQDGKSAIQGTPPMLWGTVELPPGEYVVSVNKTTRKVKIEVGKKTVLWTGELIVESEPGSTDSYAPFQGDERKLVTEKMLVNRPTALFSGLYTVKLFGSRDKDFGEVEVKTGQRTTLKQ
jgi:hypothetical protein